MKSSITAVTSIFSTSIEFQVILMYTFESCYRQSEFHYISTWLQHSILLESRVSFNLYLLEGINVTCILQCCHRVTSHMNFDVDHIALNPL